MRPATRSRELVADDLGAPAEGERVLGGVAGEEELDVALEVAAGRDQLGGEVGGVATDTEEDGGELGGRCDAAGELAGSSRGGSIGGASSPTVSAARSRPRAAAESPFAPRTRPIASASRGIVRAISTTVGSFTTQPTGRSLFSASTSRHAATSRRRASWRPDRRPRRASLRYACRGSGAAAAAP